MSQTLKLKANFRTGEFEAEGPTEVVNERFKEFREALTVPRSVSPTTVATQAPTPSAPEMPEDLEHIFSRQRNGEGVLLRVLPEGDGNYGKVANAALLVMYGFDKIAGEDEISAVGVGEALRQSGANTRNLFRPMGYLKDNHYITSQGEKRSTRYKITLKGAQKAKEILTDLLSKVGAGSNSEGQ